jgi:hypothetical protein
MVALCLLLVFTAFSSHSEKENDSKTPSAPEILAVAVPIEDSLMAPTAVAYSYASATAETDPTRLEFDLPENSSEILSLSIETLEGIDEVNLWIKSSVDEQILLNIFKHLITLRLITTDSTRSPISVAFHIGHPDAIRFLVRNFHPEFSAARRNGLKILPYSITVENASEILEIINNPEYLIPRLVSFETRSSDYLEISQKDGNIWVESFIKSEPVSSASVTLGDKILPDKQIFRGIHFRFDSFTLDQLITNKLNGYHSISVISNSYKIHTTTNTLPRNLFAVLGRLENLQKFVLIAVSSYLSKSDLEKTLATADLRVSTFFDIQITPLIQKNTNQPDIYQIVLSRYP